MTKTYSAFLSYTRLDDKAASGAISALRADVELAIQAQTGLREFSVFQDVDGLVAGDRWESRIESAIIGARLLIPILTPAFFTSKACRQELEKFIEYAVIFDMDDSIIPIYYREIPIDNREADPLIHKIEERQWIDWRSIRDLPRESANYREAIANLAHIITSRMLDKTIRTVIPKGYVRSGQVVSTSQNRDIVFISYAHVDRRWQTKLVTMLAPLVASNNIEIWDDTRIEPGGKWKKEIDAALAKTKVAVLIVTANFLASEFISKDELPPLLDRAETQGASIIWFAASDSLVAQTKIASFQAVGNPDRPLDALSTAGRNTAIRRIAEAIAAAYSR